VFLFCIIPCIFVRAGIKEKHRWVKRQKNGKITSVTDAVIVQPNFEKASLLLDQIQFAVVTGSQISRTSLNFAH
jgi:hypothetical protein